MVKKITLLIAFIMGILTFSNIGLTNDFVSAGYFIQKSQIGEQTHLNVFLVNELLPYNGQSLNGHRLYAVYYKHDHETDSGVGNNATDKRKFVFDVLIIPLNVKGETMGKGTFGAAIRTGYAIQPKGCFGVIPTYHYVTDIETKEVLLETKGNFGSTALKRGAAAEFILKHSGDHPVKGGLSKELNGI